MCFNVIYDDLLCSTQCNLLAHFPKVLYCDLLCSYQDAASWIVMSDLVLGMHRLLLFVVSEVTSVVITVPVDSIR